MTDSPNHEIQDAPEATLLRQSAAGDGRAFGELVRRHQDEVYGLVHRMVRDDGIAEELAQDVFLKAYRGLGRFRGESGFGTWLYRIAVNHVRDHVASRAVRDRKRETSLEGEELAAFEPVSHLPAPDDGIREEEAEALFARAVEALDLPLQEAFLLRHQEGRSYGEMAEILGITEGNAKVRVHRARERVLAAMREEDDGV